MDREKVIDGLIMLKRFLPSTMWEPINDAIALLKEQPEIVRCRDCKHRPTQTEPPKTYGFSIEFPEGSKCPCQCDDGFYSWYPNGDWFCANGERKEVMRDDSTIFQRNCAGTQCGGQDPEGT